MRASLIIGLLTSASTGLAAAIKSCPGHFTTPGYHQKIMNDYLAIWAGNLSLVNSTFAPHLTLQGDRFPTGAHGSVQLAPLVNSPEAFSGFVRQTRANFGEYGFRVQRWAGDGANVVFRWTLEGKVGKAFKAVPTNLKEGDAISYNGTEFLTLDACTGLIVEVSSAQDLITFMYNLGDDINLTPLSTDGQ
ncbi:hypothetical protein PWT90_01031 [Aphanocladium album]|nr:hypothetical protein PWT90_01031 [Aphanocladium album]